MSRERYRVFSRRWYKDKACTVPGAGRKTTIEIVYGEEAAQALCRSHNHDENGNRIHRPYGSAWEYERV